jgi:hypothetical protein
MAAGGLAMALLLSAATLTGASDQGTATDKRHEMVMTPTTHVSQSGVPQCSPHAEMLSVLAKQFGEAPQSIGLVGGSRVIEVLSSKEGTFTILITQPDGMACILAAGQNFEEVPDHLVSLDPQA